mmetsp:Transcript_10221/g.15558  ORF Transcript_10221/g.15558 Transcript_10221/m.15558 type:complete len:80 (-) Transcript_10221:3188-3427(-)
MTKIGRVEVLFALIVKNERLLKKEVSVQQLLTLPEFQNEKIEFELSEVTMMVEANIKDISLSIDASNKKTSRSRTLYHA